MSGRSVRTRRRLSLPVGICAAMLLTLGPGAPFVDATEGDVKASAEAAPKATAELDAMGKRLRRGAANAGLGWLEVPAGVQEIGDQHGIGAAATWGVLHGAGRAVQRTAVGLFEILTFPFKLTENDRPIIEPEFVLDPPRAAAQPPAEAETVA